MKGERLFYLLGLIDEDLIEEAGRPPVRRRFPIARLAACAALVCLCGGAWLLRDTGLNETSSADSGSGIAHDTEPVGAEGTVFMSYAGPVFPMTLPEGADGITAERHTVWDFTPGTYQDGSPRQWGAAVTDTYRLTNPTNAPITVTACYPVSGSLADAEENAPVITVDGTAQPLTLHAGAYAGGFTDAGSADGSTWNLSGPDSWTDYRSLLESGDYLAAALEAVSPADIPVTVYAFSDYTLPDDAPDAATQAIEFTIDPAATTVLTCGINGMSRDEDGGWRQYSYFVPNGIRKEAGQKLLVVLGQDIGAYTLQGYEDGGCDPGEELPGVSCTVTRYETTLDAVLADLCEAFLNTYTQQQTENRGTTPSVDAELFLDKVTELLRQYGFLAGDAMADRYSDGRLGESISETLHQERVLYWTFPVTLPAGAGVEVAVTLEKEPSFDYGCSGSDCVGLQGYDLVTHLGSSLEFTVQTAALTHTESIELADQNFGFDLEAGITEVTLDPDRDHYYLELRLKART